MTAGTHLQSLPLSAFTPGARVRIERDEKLYPPAGTWWRYVGKPGIVSILNEDAGEVGVEVGAVEARYRGDGTTLQYNHERIAWFLPHELVLK